MFSLTNAAAQQIQQAAHQARAKDMALRVAARRLPDGSLDYGMGFDEVGEGDTRLMLQDVAVVIAPAHVPLLEDTVLDYVEMEAGEFNFIFIPNESPFSMGGCGSGGGGGGSGGGCGTGGCGSGACGSGGAN